MTKGGTYFVEAGNIELKFSSSELSENISRLLSFAQRNLLQLLS